MRLPLRRTLRLDFFTLLFPGREGIHFKLCLTNRVMQLTSLKKISSAAENKKHESKQAKTTQTITLNAANSVHGQPTEITSRNLDKTASLNNDDNS